MSRISFKSLVVTAGLGLAAALSAGAANAAPAISAAPAVATMADAHGNVIKVDHRWGHRPRACSADQAANKAARMGFRRTRVDVRRNTIRVSGWRHGFRSSVLFARAPGCPIIR
jgi:hypothetical protein